jgi:RecG-like helicase
VFFRGLKWIKNRFKPGVKYVLFGKASEFNHNFNFVHPEIEEYNPSDPLIGEGKLKTENGERKTESFINFASK